MTPAERHRIIEQTFVRCIEFAPALPSTNDRALELCRETFLETPLLVLTDEQTSGRGRGANVWWSSSGALTFSLIVEPARWKLGPEFHPRISLSVALAVCRTLEAQLESADVRVKWPNDVFVASRKVCGILVEVPPRRSDLLVLGVGINVNNSFRDAPEELQSSATSLCDVDRRRRHLMDVLEALLWEMDSALPALAAPGFDLARHWELRCLLRGRRVSVNAGPRSTVGICRGIDAEGALLLETQAGVERCLGGVIASWE